MKMKWKLAVMKIQVFIFEKPLFVHFRPVFHLSLPLFRPQIRVLPPILCELYSTHFLTILTFELPQLCIRQFCLYISESNLQSQYWKSNRFLVIKGDRISTAAQNCYRYSMHSCNFYIRRMRVLASWIMRLSFANQLIGWKFGKWSHDTSEQVLITVNMQFSLLLIRFASVIVHFSCICQIFGLMKKMIIKIKTFINEGFLNFINDN